MTLQGNAVIGQSGGPTAVINQSLIGCVEALQAASGTVEKIYGAHHAVRGMVEDDFIDLSDLVAQLDAATNNLFAAPK